MVGKACLGNYPDQAVCIVLNPEALLFPGFPFEKV
jgi:hypothetical protein